MRAYPFARKCPFELPEEFAWLRRNAPVSQVSLRNGATAWLVTRHDDVRQVFADERFSRRQVRERAAGDGPFDFGLSIADPAAHQRWRRTVGAVFSPGQAEAMRGPIGELVEEVLDEMAGLPAPTDLMAAFAFKLPLEVILRLFRVPPGLRPGFESWARALRGAGASMASFGEAMRRLHETASELVARVDEGPLSDLRQAGLSEKERVSTVMLMTVAGYETAAVQFGNGFLALFQHPDELAKLAKDPALVAPAVEELLRYAQAGTGFAGKTYTTADVELGGVTIPAGSAVLISVDSAGRDEAHVERPEELDLSRGAARHHLSFGYGRHFCLGAPLARVELQEGFGRVLARLPGLAPAVDVGQVPMNANLFNQYPRELLVTW
ncbi:cytochrome P450 [Nonomuraea sp. NPDC046802]|uniref:cytochrome P450 n=1 Tax=Nonomuraea sp. NPDC046802 TaxID=3154919 RepID=UPI0033C39DAB